tara:strand:- start:5886 stop:6167 length:282 start_codon:yes stop_codon:yes gene_type:complete
MANQINASHILVKTETEAKTAYYDVTHGKDFGEVAQTISQCPSKKNGGNLGWFRKGQMVKEFEQAAFAMEKGEISKPVQTQFGWHIIKVEDTK